MPEECIQVKAESAAARHARGVDLFVASPSCKPFLPRNHGRSLEGMADGMVEMSAVLGFAIEGHPNVVVIENVDIPEAAFAINTVLRAQLRHYSWREQALGAREHAGVPHERWRRFWLGVRRCHPLDA